MTKDKRRRKRRFWRCMTIMVAFYVLSTVTLAAQYPERFSAQPEAEAETIPEPIPPSIIVDPPEETIPEIVLEVEDSNLDVPDTEPVEVTPETVSEPAQEDYAPLSYAAPSNYSESSEDRELLACVIEEEAGNQSLEGRIGVGNVVMHRVASAHYPNTIYDVLYHYDSRYGGWQFSTAPLLAPCTPSELSYQAADAVLAGENVLPESKDGKLVVFFSLAGENDDVAITIGDHVFCYAYLSEP
ncbi:MAG: cell wall hydrolase [Candidatus Saccharimonadales bacterium]